MLSAYNFWRVLINSLKAFEHFREIEQASGDWLGLD